MKASSLILCAAMAVLTILPACEKIDPESGLTQKELEELIKSDRDYAAKVSLRDDYISVYYYWNEEVFYKNSKLQPYNVPDIYNWFDTLLFEKDRWSWMEDKESYLSSETGTVSGTWGAVFTQAVDFYNDYRLYVKYILPGSPLEKHGVTRGSQLLAIGSCDLRNGIDSNDKLDYVNNHLYDSPNTFTFKLVDGREVSFTETIANSLKTNYILKSKVFTDKDFPGLTVPVGYLNFTSFVAGFIPDLARELQAFKAAGVKKMILDLRYNGGGSSLVSDTLVSYIAPANCSGMPYVVRSHNGFLKSKGFDITESVKKNDYNLNLDEIFFIMQSGSASASEMVYNGVKPFFKDKIHLVGQQSYGKPNGMYVLKYPGSNEDYDRYDKGDHSRLIYVFYPICFYNKNGIGEEIPSTAKAGSGFVPDNERPDDVFHDFDVNESDINACLTYIVSGAYPPVDRTNVKNSTKSGTGFIVPGMIPEEFSNPNYGTYTVDKVKICQENF